MNLSTIKLNSRCFKEVDECFEEVFDVVIVGGGTAAVMTALALTKTKLKILLMEPLSKLGGTLTHSVFGYYYGAEGGLFEEIDEKIKHMEQQPYMVKAETSYLFNPLARAYIYDNELRKAGVDIKFHARIEGVYLEDNTVKGIRYWCNGKLISVSCQFLVDGTAEAYAAQLAGARIVRGRSFDQSTQPFSQTATYFDYNTLTIATNNIDSGYVNQNNCFDYSEKIIEASQGKQLLKENYEDGSAMLFMSPLLGIREGNCIVGREQLKFDTIIRGKETTNPLFYTYSHVDNHGKDIAFESQEQNDWMTAMNLWSVSFSAGITMGMLLPEGVNQCIVAGRHFSRDHDMCAHSRMNRDMQKLGEAVAAIIITATKQQCQLHEVSYQDVVSLLQKTKCYTKEYYVKTAVNAPRVVGNIQTPYPTDVEEIKKQLNTNKPGLAILSAIRSVKIRDLKDWLQEEEAELRFNSAVALALLGQSDGADILINAASKHLSIRGKTSRKYNMPRGVTAIYLLGRLSYLPSLPTLLDLLKRNEMLANDVVEYDDLILNMQDYRFQYISHLIRALSQIAKKYPPVKTEILDVVKQVVFDEKFNIKVGLKVSGKVEKNSFDMTQRIKEFVYYSFKIEKPNAKIL